VPIKFLSCIYSRSTATKRVKHYQGAEKVGGIG